MSTCVPPHITVHPNADGSVDLDCSVCDRWTTISRRFGTLDKGVILDKWVKQHAHGRPA